MRARSRRVLPALLLGFAAACAPLERTSPPPPNSELIRRSAYEAASLVAAAPALASARRIAVASLERPDQSDDPVQATVEDALVEAFQTAGLSVVERDPDVLVRLAYQEGRPTLEYFVTSHSPRGDREFDPRSYATLRLGGLDSGNVWVFESGPVTGHAPIEAYSFDAPHPFHAASARIKGELLSELASADAVAAYRVLEAGVQYRNSDQRNRGVRLIRRHALTRLHVRLVNAKTGDVVWARTVTGEAGDEVLPELLPALEKPGYRYYDSGRPLYYARKTAHEPRAASEERGAGEGEEKNPGKFLLFLLLVGGAAAASGL